MKVEAYIHSLKDHENNRHVPGKAEIIRRIGDNLYLAKVNGIQCTAILNPLSDAASSMMCTESRKKAVSNDVWV